MGVLLAAIAAASYGVADYCGGRSSRSASAIAVALWAEAAGLVLVAGVMVFLDDPFPGPRDVLFGLLAAAAAAVSLAAFYEALSAGAMTVIAPITAVVSAVVPVVVGLVQGERPGRLGLAGVVLAALAIALVSGAGGPGPRRITARAMALAVVAGLGFAAVFIAFDAASDASGIWPVVIARAGSLPLLALGGLALRQSLAVPRAIAPLVVVGGIFDMTSNVLFIVSTRYGLLSIVAVVTAMYPASTVLLAYGLDGERLTKLQVRGIVLAGVALAVVALR